MSAEFPTYERSGLALIQISADPEALAEQLRSDAQLLRSLALSAEDLIGIAGRLDAVADVLDASHG